MEVEPTFVSSQPKVEKPSQPSNPGASKSRNKTIIIIVICIIISICIALVLGFVFIDQLKKRDSSGSNAPKQTQPQQPPPKPADNTEMLERIRILKEQEEEIQNQIDQENQIEAEEANSKFLDFASTVEVKVPTEKKAEIPVFNKNDFEVKPPKNTLPMQVPADSQPLYEAAPAPQPAQTMTFSFSMAPETKQPDIGLWSDEEDDKIIELEEKNEPTTESDDD